MNRYALVNGHILDGSEHMSASDGLAAIVSRGRFEAVLPEDDPALSGIERIDLKGAYLAPGLINLHVHLAAAGKPPRADAEEKPVDYKGLMDTLGKRRLVRRVLYRMAEDYAKTELLSGVTTIRAVGGLWDIDGRVRDAVEAGRVAGPRIIAANTAVSVPGGHFAGSLATEARTPEEAVEHVRRSRRRAPTSSSS